MLACETDGRGNCQITARGDGPFQDAQTAPRPLITLLFGLNFPCGPGPTSLAADFLGPSTPWPPTSLAVDSLGRRPPLAGRPSAPALAREPAPRAPGHARGPPRPTSRPTRRPTRPVCWMRRSRHGRAPPRPRRRVGACLHGAELGERRCTRVDGLRGRAPRHTTRATPRRSAEPPAGSRPPRRLSDAPPAHRGRAPGHAQGAIPSCGELTSLSLSR